MSENENIENPSDGYQSSALQYRVLLTVLLAFLTGFLISEGLASFAAQFNDRCIDKKVYFYSGSDGIVQKKNKDGTPMVCPLPITKG